MESVGVNQNVCRLFAKVLLSFTHHICSGYRISKDSYGSKKEHYAGAGQEKPIVGRIM